MVIAGKFRRRCGVGIVEAYDPIGIEMGAMTNAGSTAREGFYVSARGDIQRRMNVVTAGRIRAWQRANGVPCCSKAKTLRKRCPGGVSKMQARPTDDWRER